MALKARRVRRLPPGSALIWPTDTPRGVLIDGRYRKKLLRVRWRFLPKRKRFRGYFGASTVRKYLHRYILELAGKYYPEVTFINGDEFDCRLTNLKPYRREDEGAQRHLFRNSTSKRKGVSWHKGRKRWIAMIRTKGKLRHLGYHKTPDRAANAYALAWNAAHPNLPQLPIQTRSGLTT